MKFAVSTALIFFSVCIVTGFSQMILPDLKGRPSAAQSGSDTYKSQLSGCLGAHQNGEKWKVHITNNETFRHTTSVKPNIFTQLKDEANQVRTLRKTPHSTLHKSGARVADAPVITRNFRGNTRDNSVPMDNSMAISRNGFIVSGINSNIIFTGPDGKITYNGGLSDFFTLLSLSTRMYDPRVIYDSEANRFIFMCLHGSEPSNTFLCLAFSKTEDPNGEWFYYKVDGNPSGDNHWFDYPNIALSSHDFYIAGLMRDTPGDWKYSVVYQLDKNDGYLGKELRWKYYNEINNADGEPAFNLVPTQSGWSTLISPGMYFVSNVPTGGNKYNLYYTTGTLEDNPQLISTQITGITTSLAPDGRQPGTTNVLNTFDSRIWSALYLNGTIHMGSHVGTTDGDVGLFYARMKVSNLELHGDILQIPNRDMAFPSFSSLGKTEDDPKILVNYLVAGTDIYPGQQQRICTGTFGNFEWSEPVTLKEGTSHIDVLSDTNERWGDYTTSCRRFFDGRTETWVTGCFGESRSYGTWLGQLMTSDDESLLPAAEFTADKTTTSKMSDITFTDLTPKNANNRMWKFEGGQPSTSTDLNPIIKYIENGAYDVTLIVTNDAGTDTITKKQYIHIQDPIVKPVAEFKQEKDSIYVGESVRFTNASSENAVTYKWTFQQGTPSTSTEKNPVVKYTKTGSFLVSLTAANIAGNHTKIKQKAVTVLERTMPRVAFVSDKTNVEPGDSVRFYDTSTGGPSSWNWSFEGGEPSISTVKNPIVTYKNPGIYNVSLKVGNDAGQDALTKYSFINVGTSSTSQNDNIKIIKIFPNPVNDIVSMTIVNPIADNYRISLMDANGSFVANLFQDKIKSGSNTFSFSTESLAQGIYFIKITSTSQVHLSQPIIVVK